MKKKIYLHSKFWTTSLPQNLSHGAKLLALYCLTGSHRLISYPQKISLVTALKDLNWPAEILTQRLEELSHNALIKFTPDSDCYEISAAFQQAFSKVTTSNRRSIS